MTFSRPLRISWLMVGIDTFQNKISSLAGPGDTNTGPKGGASYAGNFPSEDEILGARGGLRAFCGTMPARTTAKKTMPPRKTAPTKKSARSAKPAPARKPMKNGEMKAQMFEVQAAHDAV